MCQLYKEKILLAVMQIVVFYSLVTSTVGSEPPLGGGETPLGGGFEGGLIGEPSSTLHAEVSSTDSNLINYYNLADTMFKVCPSATSYDLSDWFSPDSSYSSTYVLPLTGFKDGEDTS